ncbi:MAG: PAS domain-containing protein, partial [Gemmatimonadetes bacterium]|nr:PAS domain-containing protein [Gemmatimonadota bacterium]
MFATLPQWHGALVSLSAIGTVGFGAAILARNPRSVSARLHFIYAAVVAGWLICLGNGASATGEAEALWWGRTAQIFVGALVGIAYHLNMALAGLRKEYRRRIQFHWGLAAVIIFLSAGFPGWVVDVRSHSWGYYPVYSPWGWITVAAVALAMLQAMVALRASMNRNDPRTAQHQKARAFYRGNAFTCLALVDFLPAFGVTIYPAGYIIVSIMHAATLYGSVRYRLIEITPEFAADHVFREVPEGLLVVDTRGLVRLANPAAARMLDQDLPTLIDRALEDRRGVAARLVRVVNEGPRDDGPTEIRVGALGDERIVRATSTTLLDQMGFPVAHMWVLTDVTAQRLAEADRERLEEGFQHVQKLESLGIMASGIAHDFNNLLVGVLGHAELARNKVHDPGATTTHLTKIRAAAERAAELTGQMLTYTGKQPKKRRVLDVNDLVEEISELMRAAMPKKSTLTLDLAPALPPIEGDPGQLSQVILNLITNASDALGDSPGAVTVRTGVFVPDVQYYSWDSESDDPPGEHVVLEVCDTGHGMTEDVRSQIFDPFFTTKLLGRGLGLATVLGIVRGHHGRIRVDSAPGRGTCFGVALPVGSISDRTEPGPAADRRDWQGAGLALLVDD